VVWVRGSVFRRECMKWVRGLYKVENKKTTQAAQCFMVLSDAQAGDPDGEDNKAIQRAVAIRRQNPHIRIIVQILSHANKHRLYQESVEILCVEELKYGLMGRSCQVSGLNTLISTIFKCREYVDFNTKTLKQSAAAGLDTLGDTQHDKEQVHALMHLQDKKESLKWKDEWLLNSTRDIAQMLYPPELEGLLFQHFSAECYKEFGHIVFAIELPPTEDHPTPRTIVNPHGFRLRGGDSVIFLCNGRRIALEFEIKMKKHLQKRIQNGDLKTVEPFKEDSEDLEGEPKQLLKRRDTVASGLLAEIEAQPELTKQQVPALVSRMHPSFYTVEDQYDQKKIDDWGAAHIVPNNQTVPANLKNHIIFYGPLSSAAYFLQPLARECQPQHVVFIIDSTEKIDRHLLEQICFYENLHIVIGDITESNAGLPWCRPSTFIRAGVERAALFVMPNMHGTVDESDSLLGDERVVQVLRNLREHKMHNLKTVDVIGVKPKFMVELLHRHHIEYIRRPLPRPMAYASGQVYSNDFLQSFPAKMFHSSANLPILEHMISSWDSRVFVDVPKESCRGSKVMESCHVVLKKIPVEFHNKPFVEFYEFCTQSHTLCLGLYRHHADWDVIAEQRSNSMCDAGLLADKQDNQLDAEVARDLRYVYVNPRQHDLIGTRDKCYLMVNHHSGKDWDDKNANPSMTTKQDDDCTASEFAAHPEDVHLRENRTAPSPEGVGTPLSPEGISIPLVPVEASCQI